MVKYFVVLSALALPLGWHYRDSFIYRDAPMTVFHKRGVVFHDRWRSGSEPLVLMHYLSRHGCEFIDRTGAPQGLLNWSLCLPTPEGTVAIAEKNLLFFETTGDLRWDLPASIHHDLDADIGRRELIVPERSFQNRGGKRIKVEAVSIYTFAGDRVFHWIANDHLNALAQILERELPLQKVEEMDFYEYTHINGVQIVPSTPLKDKLEAFRPGNVLVSLNTNGLVILDRDSGKPLWIFKISETYRKQFHSPRILPNGNILLLVNEDELRPGHSSLIEIDPQTNEILWSYRAREPGGFSHERFGSVFRLANGNTLVTHVSHGGAAFEVTASGRLVWEWINPESDSSGRPLDVYRLAPTSTEVLLKNRFIQIR